MKKLLILFAFLFASISVWSEQDKILKYDFEDSKDIDILIKNIRGRLGNLPRSKTAAEKIFINTIYRSFKELNSRIHICAKYKKQLKETINKL